jgi:peptide/nickel transport system substrate-binding protein
MHGNRRPPRRGVFGSLVAAAALIAAIATASTSGASVPAQDSNIDKNAVLRGAFNLTEQGGVNFDPNNATLNPISRNFWDLIYDTMIVLDPKTDKLAPGLATKWATPDPRTIVLTLRDNVKFADGTPFNAAAVKAAWDKQLNCARTNTVACPSTPPEIKDAWTSVDAVDDHTVRISMNKPVADTVIHDHLTSTRYLAVPSPSATNLNDKPVGAGPYQVKNFVKDSTLTLDRNPNYWNPKSQKLAGYELQAILPGQPAISALQAGTVDVIWNFTPDQIGAIQGVSGVKVENEPGIRTNSVNMCVSNGVFANKAARQAMQYAIDRQEINKAALGGKGDVTAVAVPRVHPLYDDNFAAAKLKQYAYNPKKAAKLLRDAGVADETKVRLMTSTNPGQPQMAEVVKSQLAKVGLDAEITVTPNVTADSVRPPQPDIVLVGIQPEFWSIAFVRNSTLNHCGFSNPEVTAALETMQDGSKTEADRKAAAEKFQDVVLDESPLVFSATGPLLGAHTKNVKGWDGIIWPSGPVLRTLYKTG